MSASAPAESAGPVTVTGEREGTFPPACKAEVLIGLLKQVFFFLSTFFTVLMQISLIHPVYSFKYPIHTNEN